MVNRRPLIFALLALSFGLSGAYVNYQWLNSRADFVAPASVSVATETAQVRIARTEISAGHEILDKAVESVKWPLDLLPPGAFVGDDSPLGRVPMRTIAAGEPILESALLAEGAGGGLSPIITEGMRAVAVQVDEVVGIAGFVKPGSHVDVLATIRDRRGEGSTFAKVILQDVKVLAIDQSLEEKSTSAEPKLVSVVTLEVTPANAQSLAFAAHEGQLQLALRNPTDTKSVRTSAVSAASLRGYTARIYRNRVEVISGVDVVTERF
ncbi:MAG: Flp pilus assembly protein CpaB [Myxococcota bacterium]